MLELKKYNKEDLKSIFGQNRSEIYFYDIWVEKYPILTNNDVFKWITSKIRKFAQDGKNPENFQITSYLNPLQQYCNHNEVNNPSDLLKENLDERNKRLMDYLTSLLNKENSNETSIKNAYQSRIKSFYSARGFPTTDGFKTKKSGKNLNEMNLNREKIQKILNIINNSNYKLACKIQIHLGLRIGDVLNQLPKCKILKHEKHYYIKDFKTEKENVEIKYMFFPIELTKLLQSIYNIEDLTKLDLSKDFLRTHKSKTKGGGIILASEYRKKLKNIAFKLYPNENMKTHSFRKYFRTQLNRVNLTLIRSDIGSNVENLFKEHLLGHEVSYEEKVYNQILNDINQFYELWKPLENALCINLEVVNTPNKDILDMREQIVKLEKENKAIHEERTKIKEELKEITSKIPNLLEFKEDFENMKNELYNLRMKNKLTEKNISEKEIIETLGLNANNPKSNKKLNIK